MGSLSSTSSSFSSSCCCLPSCVCKCVIGLTPLQCSSERNLVCPAPTLLTYNDTNPALPSSALLDTLWGDKHEYSHQHCQTSHSDWFLAFQRKTLFSFVFCDLWCEDWRHTKLRNVKTRILSSTLSLSTDEINSESDDKISFIFRGIKLNNPDLTFVKSQQPGNSLESLKRSRDDGLTALVTGVVGVGWGGQRSQRPIEK